MGAAAAWLSASVSLIIAATECPFDGAAGCGCVGTEDRDIGYPLTGLVHAYFAPPGGHVTV